MSIAIVFGGKSVEHDVSIVTAKQIYNLFKDDGDVKLIYVGKDGDFFLYKNKDFEFEDFKGSIKNIQPITFHDGYVYANRLGIFSKKEKIDCAIMCCHGGDGENGKVVSMLNMAKIPTTVGSHTALGISMNKWLTKQFLRATNIGFVKGFNALKNDNIDKLDSRIINSFGYPVIVKPNGGGSSIGIATAKNKEDLKTALEIAFEFDSSAVIEKEIENFTEYNCAVFGDEDSIQISKIDEPIKNEEILSFEDKYLSGNKKGSMKTQQRKYPVLDKFLEDKIQKTSKRLFLELGFYGVIRIDYIYDKKTGKLYVNEINAIPGSLGSYFFARNIIEGKMFVKKLIDIGIKNYKQNNQINKNFITKLF